MVVIFPKSVVLYIYCLIKSRKVSVTVLSDIYLLRFKQRWGVSSISLENAFFYERTAGTPLAIGVAQMFEEQVLPNINAIQTQFVKNVGVDVLNMGDPTDFVYYPLTGEGTISGQTLPPQSAVSYTLKLNTRAVRPGGKRFSGVPEAVQSDGEIQDAGYITAMNVLRVQLYGELIDSENTLKPVVLKRIKEAVAGTVPTRYTYRLPTVLDPLVVGDVLTATVGIRVGNQVSRKS